MKQSKPMNPLRVNIQAIPSFSSNKLRHMPCCMIPFLKAMQSFDLRAAITFLINLKHVNKKGTCHIYHVFVCMAFVVAGTKLLVNFFQLSGSSLIAPPSNIHFHRAWNSQRFLLYFYKKVDKETNFFTHEISWLTH